MEPIPETVEAIEELGPFAAGDLLQPLLEQARLVQELVPDCVGLSLASVTDDITLTLVATSEEIAALDGVQYVFGGPCVDGVKVDEVIEYNNDEVLDEHRWQHFARATSAAEVASTLTLPVMADGVVVGSVNLYAASRDAFEGRHADIARIFHAWAPGAVTNADLSFDTRRSAEQAHERLEDALGIDIAVGLISASRDIDLDAARDHLRNAALRAGISEAALAQSIIVSDRSIDDE
jgi:GAF domain-containing protein